MPDLGTAYVRIRPDVSGFRSAADRSIKSELAGVDQEANNAARGVDNLTKSLDENTASTSRNHSVLGDIVSNWKLMVPAAVGLGTAVIGMTSGFAALAPVLPVIAAGLAALLTPFTTAAAVVAGFIPPVLLLTGLLGSLGAAFLFGFKAAAEGGGVLEPVAKAMATLGSVFDKTGRILGVAFMPYFLQLISAAKQALLYIDQLAKMPLDQAFQSIATKGVRMLTDFVNGVAKVLAKPIREAFKVAFDDQSTLHKALVGFWNRITDFFLNQKNGVLLPVEKWFGKQDFTAVGQRWANELAGATLTALGAAFGKLLSTTGGKIIGAGGAAGLGIGAVIGGPLGAAIGLAIGTGIGIAINHYWPKLQALISGKPALKVNVAVIGQGRGQGHLDQGLQGPAPSVAAWRTGLHEVVHFFAWAGKELEILTVGQYKIILSGISEAVKGVKLWGGAIEHLYGFVRGKLLGAWHTVGGYIGTLAGIIQHPIAAARQFGGYVGGGLVAAWHTVSSVIGTIAGAIQHPIGAVQTLAGVVSGPLHSAWNAISGIVNSVLGAIQSMAGAAQSVANIASSIHFPSLPGLPHIPGLNAGGTDYWRGGLSWVGEKGPELVNLPRGSQVIPHDQSMKLAGSGGNTYNMYLNTPSGVPEHVARQVMNAIARKAGA